MASGKDELGRARRGSQCQMQLYVNSRQRRVPLDRVVLESLPSLRAAGAVTLSWRSPLADVAPPFAEYRDGRVLHAIDRSDLRDGWRRYWPARAQVWDGLAVALDV